jgi:hypothetical protein
MNVKVIPLPECYRNPQYVGPIPYCLTGTNYGFLHRTDGSIRTWWSRGGAYKAKRRYEAIWK